MGQVFKARHRSMDRIVALKVLAKAAVNSPDAIKRFQREVKAAAKLIHPNIVIAHDAGQQDGVHFLVMEYVPGSDLSALVKREGPLPVDKVVSYITQAARGLAFAHAKGVVHRDIKPGNLLVDHEGTVRILDMGLARLDGDAASKAAGEGLTQTGQVMGTVDYMAPEQAFDTSTADAKADLYSLGCTLYRLLTGQNMFSGDTLVQKILAHREQPIPSLVVACPNVPPQLDAIYQRMVAKQPTDRPTMAELVVELENFFKGESTTTYATSRFTEDFDRKQSAATHTLKKDEDKLNHGGGKKPPSRKLLAAGAAGFLFVCWAVWVIVRDKDGNEVGRMKVPGSGSAIVIDVHQPSEGAEPKPVEDPNAKSKLSARETSVSTPDPRNARAFAEFIISHGGKVTPVGFKGDDGRPLEVGRVSELPSGDWTIEAISLRTNSLATDDFMSRLAQVPNVRRLYLHDAKLTAIGVRHLCAIPTLEELWLTHVPVGDEIMKDVVRLPALKRLVIALTNISDASLNYLKQMPQLTFLDVSGTTVSDSGLRELSNLRQLTYLNFRGTSISDVGLEHLTNLKKLKTLILERTRVSSQGLESIRRALPGLEIDLGQSSTEVATGPPVAVASLSSPIDLLKQIPSQTNATGIWTASETKLDAIVNDPTKATQVAVPFVAPEEYDLSAVVDRLTTENAGVTLGLSAGAARFRIDLDYASARNTKLAEVDGKAVLGTSGPWLTPGKAHDVRVEVRRSGIRVRVDDRVVLTYDGTLDRLSREYVDTPFYLKVYNSTRFHKLELTPVVSPPPAIAKAPFDAAQARAHQETWAKQLGTTVETTNSVGMKMVLIPPGEFLMGSTDEQVEAALKIAEQMKADSEVTGRIEKSERPQHKVVIPNPLRMSATEVTIGQFKKFSATGYQTEAEKAEAAAKIAPPADAGQAAPKPISTFLNPGFAVTDASPAGAISWNDAVAYCQWLGEQEKTAYRLPTEAEWEYACRAGTTTLYSFGDDASLLGQYGWYGINASRQSHPVGVKSPNGFGLFDMHGNIHEWCGDFYDEKWYEKHSSNDPKGPAVGSYGVLRGGYWNLPASYCRTAFRKNDRRSDRYNYYGFRVVQVLDNPPTTAQAARVTPPLEAKPTVTAPRIAVAPFDAATARAHQEAWAKYLGVTVETTNSIGMKFMLIPPGEFLMGSTDDEIKAALKLVKNEEPDNRVLGKIQNEGPRQRVVITRPFWMSATEVTHGQLEQYMRAMSVAAGTSLVLPLEAADLPISNANWHKAADFCNWLSRVDGFAPVYESRDDEWSVVKTADGYHLAGEAQWEHACRAGTTTQYSFGDDIKEAPRYAVFNAERPAPVASKLPNAFGLFDMHGNVAEWCQYGAKEEFGSRDHGTVPVSRTRPLRGGSYKHGGVRGRSAFSGNAMLSDTNPGTGIRVVREIPLP